MLNSLINALISGIVLGSIYCVMSMGLTLVYGVGRVFNFAHGAFIIWGAYLTWFFFTELQLNYAIAIIISIILLLIGSAFIERLIIRPLRRKPQFGITSVLVTLGLAITMSNAGIVIFDPRLKKIPRLVSGTLEFSGYIIGYHELVTLCIATFIIISLEFFLRRTMEGTALRAISQDSIGARIVGMDLDKLFCVTFSISATLAGLSGILLAPKFLIAPSVGWMALFKAVVIVIFGGLGSVKGTLISAFFLGIVEGLVAMYLGMFWVQPIWFILLLGILVVKPKGLYGAWA